MVIDFLFCSALSTQHSALILAEASGAFNFAGVLFSLAGFEYNSHKHFGSCGFSGGEKPDCPGCSCISGNKDGLG
jgi:hypothetical protein